MIGEEQTEPAAIAETLGLVKNLGLLDPTEDDYKMLLDEMEFGASGNYRAVPRPKNPPESY